MLRTEVRMTPRQNFSSLGRGLGLADLAVPVHRQTSPQARVLPQDSLAKEELGGETRGSRTQAPGSANFAFLQGGSATCARTRPTRSTSCRQGASHSSSAACPVLMRRRCCLLSPHSCT